MTDDLISREAALKAACEGFCHPGIFCPDTGCKELDPIKNLPAAEQWTPCIERLPEKKRSVYWICTDTGYQCECRWTNNQYGLGESDEWDWSIFDTPQYSHPVAWMPLPEPYKGEQNE